MLRLRRYQFPRAADVMLVGRSVDGIRDDADDVVGGDVHLHAEMPRISLFLPLAISGSRL